MRPFIAATLSTLLLALAAPLWGQRHPTLDPPPKARPVPPRKKPVEKPKPRPKHPVVPAPPVPRKPLTS